MFLPDDPGAVGLKCNPGDKKTIYVWLMCAGNLVESNFNEIDRTETSSTFIGGLDNNAVYWFKVMRITGKGDSVSGAKGIVTS